MRGGVVGSIEPPRSTQAPAPQGGAGRVASPRTIQEPPTARALWPTFMRRTLAEEHVRPLSEREPRAG